MNISFPCFLKYIFLFLLTLRDTGDYKAFANTYNSDYNRPYHPYNQRLTREIILKQGVLQGIVVDPRINRDIAPAEQYRGIPYAAPPVDQLRFMPPGSATSWFGIKYADTFGPVCPQMLPDGRGMDYARREEVERLKEQLQNQSEDCLYLNVYAPYQEAGNTGIYPVIVFLHGESYEWNSGNPYDGNVLASYGKVVVVTLNYRLGVLGFLRAGTEESSRSNFGLVDQIAALLWVKDNIAAFGGNPSSVTLMGHGVGAACASLLMISPMVLHQGQALFQRAILMGGTALADWALAGNPLEVTYQVAQSLNCQIHDDFATCLRRKRLDEIISAIALTPPYRTRFGPIVDSIVVPNDPVRSMTNYTDLFRRFELMYGTTQLEPHHSLNPVAMTHGMLDMERDEELLRFLQPRCEVSSDFCLSRTLAEYSSEKGRRDTSYKGFMALQPDKAAMNRDIVLDVLSDARTVAPIVKMGRLHSSLNSQSYFYVFTHKTYSKEYLTNKTYSGEELPYVFGVPLDGPKFHFTDQYTEEERLLSETMMTYVSNFAYTGDPNVQSKSEYYSLGPVSWKKFNIDWPEFDPADESYLQLDTPPQVHNHYRHKEINYWNKLFPFLADADANTNFLTSTTQKPDYGHFPPFISSTRSSGRDPGRQPTTSKGIIFGTVKHTDRKGPDNMMNNNAVYGTVVNNAPETPKTSTTNIIIAVCIVVLIGNLIFFAALYYKCYRIRRNKNGANKNDEETETLDDVDGKNVKLDEAFDVSDCNLMKMLSKNSKSDDTYEAINGNSAHSSKFKLKRQMSNSTIDAHTKVRDWIAHEIVHKYSPKFFRQTQSRTVKQKPKEENDDDSIKLPEKDSTLGRSPTRPVSPTDDIISDIMRSPPANQLLKSSHPKTRKPEKVSVGVDATTNIRNFFAKTDNPLSQSLDYPSYPLETPLRRSLTLEDFSPRKVDAKPEMAKSTTNIHRKTLQGEIIKISHRHSRSDPVQDFYSRVKKLKTFDPNADINVTSRDEDDKITPLTPEEALRTIKRRNYPKVLPDYPSREALVQKRRSMPASSHHVILPIPENPLRLQVPAHKIFTRMPPAPPPRISSTLGRVPGSQTSLPLYQSEPTLAEEPQSSPEPEVTYNNLYVGPILPKLTKKLSCEDRQDSIPESTAGEIEEVDYNSSNVEKIEPRTTIKLGLTRNIIGDPKISLQKTNSGDGDGDGVFHQVDNKTETKKNSDETDKPMPRHVSGIPVRSNSIKLKSIKSQIPVKSSNSSLNKESSSSESTSPSEASDTGTVVKKI